MLGVPCAGWIQFVTANTLLNLSQDRRYNLQIILGEHKPYENNQHHIVKAFLQSPCEWLMLMDADNPPTRNALDYIEKDCDIVSFPTPIFQANRDTPWHLNVYREKGEWEYTPFTPAKGFVEVEGTGSGCLLLKRCVLERIPAPFASIWWPDGTRKLGGDLAFSKRARGAGFKIMAAFDCLCCHFTSIEGLRSIQQMENHVRTILLKNKVDLSDRPKADSLPVGAYGLTGVE